LTSKSDLELGGRDAGDAYDTSSYYSDYLLIIYKILWSRKKLWTRHNIYSITDYVDLWPPSVTLTLEVGDWLCALHIVALLWTIVASIYKIPSKVLSYGPDTTCTLKYTMLTLEVRVWLLRLTHCLIITNICAKLFQIPLINDKVMEWTRNVMDRRTEPSSISIYPIFLRKGVGQKKIQLPNSLGPHMSECACWVGLFILVEKGQSV
jgi:hypothetical protein